MKQRTVHLSWGQGVTLCGQSIHRYQPRGNAPMHTLQRRQPLAWTNYVDSATCKSCHRVDNSQSIKQYAKDCKAAGVPCGEL